MAEQNRIQEIRVDLSRGELRTSVRSKTPEGVVRVIVQGASLSDSLARATVATEKRVAELREIREQREREEAGVPW